MTKIEWTDESWNPISGCDRVSPGCTHCYAERLTATRLRKQPKYRGLATMKDGVPHWTGEIRLHHNALDIPFKWRRGRRIFVCDMSDLFHPKVPFEFIDKVFATAALLPRHTFQLLTKRIDRALEYLTSDCGLEDRYTTILRQAEHTGRVVWDTRGSDPDNYQLVAGRKNDLANRRIPPKWPLRNVWLGTSVEDQKRADERVPKLLECPAAIRFLSMEPLLERTTLYPKAPLAYRMLSRYYGAKGFDPEGSQPERERYAHLFPKIDWVIIGLESGPKARRGDADWVLQLIRECRGNTATFVKQFGSNPSTDHRTRPADEGAFWTELLRDPKGGDPSEWPERYRIREFPKC